MVLDDDVSVDIEDGAMLPPLVLAVRPVLPLPMLLWEMTVAPDGRLSSNAMGQLIVTFNEHPAPNVVT
jgi:hypothetical protein